MDAYAKNDVKEEFTLDAQNNIWCWDIEKILKN